MDLGTPGDEMTDVIGEAKMQVRTEVVFLLERFRSDASKTRDEIRTELGINGQSPSPLHSSFNYRIEFFCFQFRFPCDHPTQAHAGGVPGLS